MTNVFGRALYLFSSVLFVCLFTLKAQAKDVLPPSVSIIKPVANQIFSNEQVIKIEWDAIDDTGIIGQDISAATSSGGNFSDIVIATGLAGDVRSFDWKPGQRIIAETVYLRITVRDAEGNIGVDTRKAPFAVRLHPIIKAVEYRCGFISIYGDGFNVNSLITLNGKSLVPPRTFVKLQPLPSPDPQKGSQVLIVEYRAQGKGTKDKGKFDNTIGKDNPVIVSTDGLVSKIFVAKGTGPKVPRVNITFPPNDVLFKEGTEITITWDVNTPCEVKSQQIKFATGNRCFDDLPYSESKDFLVADLDGSARSFTWVVPKFFTTIGRLRVSATDIEATGFDIVGTGNPDLPPSLTIKSPSQATQFNAGDSIPIEFDYEGCKDPVRYDIQLGTLRKSIPANSQSFKFDLPDSFRLERGTLRISAIDNQGQVIITGQVGGISVVGPRDTEDLLIELLEPKGNPILAVGQLQKIRWKSNDDVIFYRLEFSNNDGILYRTLTIREGNFAGIELSHDFLVRSEDVTQGASGILRIVGVGKDKNGKESSGQAVVTKITVQR